MKRLNAKVILTILAVSTAWPAQAETLRDALVKAYQSNPTLTGARAEQRANDENVPLARARGLPSADVSGSYNETIDQSGSSFGGDRTATGRVDINVPLYQGGAVKNSTLAAKTRVLAGQAGLRGTETSLFSNVVGAYMDVLRDQAIVALNRAQVGVLDVNLQATRDRFEVGDLTRTDIAQSEARLARAQSQYRAAEADLIGSRERYVQLVGDAPSGLQQPPELPGLPKDPDQAVAKALNDNPDLIAANLAAKASGFDIKTARASRLPRVAGVANGSYSDFLGSVSSPVAPGSQRSVGAGVQASFPLFQGGSAGAQIRQSQARLSQAQERVIETERGVIAQTRSAYAAWRASNEVIKSSDVAVSANKLALEGVRAENSVGTRTILDILDAEQELLNSQVELVRAQRNSYVAGFTLLASMGDAEYTDLGLEGGALYDPNVNYDRVRKSIWDWSNDPNPSPVAKRTVDIPAQNPAVSNYPGK
jgi:outer membrane protein